MSDRTIVINGSVIKMKYAKKLDRVRHDFFPLDQSESLKDESYRYYRIITISKVNASTVALDPQEQTYAEAPDGFNLVSFDIEALLKSASAVLGKIRIENSGSEIIDGSKATRLKVRFDDSTEAMYFYFAKDKGNLFIKMDSGTIKQIKGSYTVSNVSFDVPDEVFEIPTHYKRTDFNSMITTLKQKALK